VRPRSPRAASECRRREEDGLPAELVHAGLERDAGARGRLLEEEPESLAAQPLRGQGPPAHGLQGGGLRKIERISSLVRSWTASKWVRRGGHRRASITSPSVVTTRSISACVTINGGTNRQLALARGIDEDAALAEIVNELTGVHRDLDADHQAQPWISVIAGHRPWRSFKPFMKYSPI